MNGKSKENWKKKTQKKKVRKRQMEELKKDKWKKKKDKRKLLRDRWDHGGEACALLICHATGPRRGPFPALARDPAGPLLVEQFTHAPKGGPMRKSVSNE